LSEQFSQSFNAVQGHKLMLEVVPFDFDPRAVLETLGLLCCNSTF